MLTDETGSYCNGGPHSLFTSRSGLRSVLWTCICKVVACNLCSTYSERWKYVSGSSKFGDRFLCRSHILALIFVDLWSQVVWGRLWHRYYWIICANVGKKPARNSDIFNHRLQLVYNLQLPACRRLLFPLLHAEKGHLRNAVANRVPESRWQGILFRILIVK